MCKSVVSKVKNFSTRIPDKLIINMTNSLNTVSFPDLLETLIQQTIIPLMYQ